MVLILLCSERHQEHHCSEPGKCGTRTHRCHCGFEWRYGQSDLERFCAKYKGENKEADMLQGDTG